MKIKNQGTTRMIVNLNQTYKVGMREDELKFYTSRKWCITKEDAEWLALELASNSLVLISPYAMGRVVKNYRLTHMISEPTGNERGPQLGWYLILEEVPTWLDIEQPEPINFGGKGVRYHQYLMTSF